MIDARALALGLADVAPFSPPPHRPVAPERRTDGGDGLGRTLLRAIRRELAQATEEPVVGQLPRIQHHPY